MNGKLYAVSAAARSRASRTGTIRWTFRFAEYPGERRPVVSHSPPAGADGIGTGASPTIGPDGTIYIGANNSNFYAISPDGQLRMAVRSRARDRRHLVDRGAQRRQQRRSIFGANKGGIYAVNRCGRDAQVAVFRS